MAGIRHVVMQPIRPAQYPARSFQHSSRSRAAAPCGPTTNNPKNSILIEQGQTNGVRLVVPRWFLAALRSALAGRLSEKTTRLELHTWYSWVDSNHRPPDPQKAITGPAGVCASRESGCK